MCRTLTNGLGWTSTVIVLAAMAVVVFSGCAHSERKPPCVSECGMLLEDVGNGAMSCGKLQEAEDLALAAYDEIKGQDPRFEKNYACGQLFGWQLKLEQSLIMYDSSINSGAPFVGLSDCGSKTMTLMRANSWRDGSYVHEIAHAIQSCSAPITWGKSTPYGAGPGHEGWMDHGVYDIIRDFREGRR